MNDQPKLRGSVLVTLVCEYPRDLKGIWEVFQPKPKLVISRGAVKHWCTVWPNLYMNLFDAPNIAMVIHKRMRIRASSPILLASSSTLRSVHVIPSVARYHLDTDTMCECSASWEGSLDHMDQGSSSRPSSKIWSPMSKCQELALEGRDDF